MPYGSREPPALKGKKQIIHERFNGIMVLKTLRYVEITKLMQKLCPIGIKFIEIFWKPLILGQK